MPCNESGWSDAEHFSQLGIVSFDMNNAQDIWEASSPQDPESILEQQCAKVKAIDSEVKCGVYRNSAHLWSNYELVRAKLQDPEFWGFFLPWANTTARQYDVEAGAGANLYWDDVQSPHLAIPPWSGKCQCVGTNIPRWGTKPCQRGPVCNCGGSAKVPCGQFMFDFRNESLRRWLTGDYLLGPTGLGSTNVDFLFLDDSWDVHSGPSEVAPGAVAKMGLSAADVQDLTAAYTKTMRAMQETVVAHNGFAWASFHNGGTLAGPPVSPSSCADYMRTVACREDSVLQRSTLFYGFPRGDYPPFVPPNASEVQTATNVFMLIRGAHAFLGYSWVGCSGDCGQWQKANQSLPPEDYCPSYGQGGNRVEYKWPANRNDDFGEPMEVCHQVEGQPNVWTRQYTKSTFTVDCTTWEATVQMGPPPPPPPPPPRPNIVNMGSVDVGLIVETTPIVFDGELHRFEAVHVGYHGSVTPGSNYLRFVHVRSGVSSPPLPDSAGYALGSAYTDGTTVFAFGTFCHADDRCGAPGSNSHIRVVRYSRSDAFSICALPSR